MNFLKIKNAMKELESEKKDKEWNNIMKELKICAFQR